MTFEGFLTWHQELTEHALKGTFSVEEGKRFTREINIGIEAFADVSNRLRFEVRRWDERLSQLCLLRDQMYKLTVPPAPSLKPKEFPR